MNADDLRDFGELAFQTAHFIHCDRVVAIGVVKEALDALKVSLDNQKKVQYYRLKGQRPHDPETGELQGALPPRRSKPFLPESLMLQRLVYILSEPVERQQELPGVYAKLSEEDLLARYIKHLVRITLKRSSSYVTIGVSRMVYNYKTSEICELYSLVSPDGLGSDDFRVRKAKLMREMEARFNSLLKFDDHTRRGEKRFRPHPEPARFASLVTAYLDFLNLWKWPCILTDWSGSSNDPIERFSYQGGNPNNKSDIELNRFHCIIHSRDYERLINALGFDHPGKRLMIPQFQLGGNMNNSSGNGSGGTPVDRSTARMSEEEWRDLKSYLDKQTDRRKTASVRSLFIEVNGIECASIDLDSACSVQFQVDETAELIEFKTRLPQGDLRMATLLLDQSDLDDERTLRLYEIALPGGRKLQFSIAPTRDELNEIAGARIDLSYQEASLLSAAAGLWRRYLAFALPNQDRKTEIASTIKRVIITIPGLIGFKGVANDPLSLSHLDQIEPESGRFATTRRRRSLTTMAYALAGLLTVMVPWLMWKSSQLSTQNELLRQENARLIEDVKQAANREAHIQQLLTAAQKQLEERAIQLQNSSDGSIALALNDGARQVTLDAQGNIAGLPSLSPIHQQMVRGALTGQQIKAPSEIRDLKSTAGTLIGTGEDGSFHLRSPVGVVVQSNLPTLQWKPLDGATSYTVIITDSQYRQVATSPSLSGTEWTVDRPLERGTMYLWQVIARKDGKEVKLPRPPLVGAKFQVLEQGKADRLEREKKIYAGSHLMLGLLYTRAGLLDDAEREFNALLAANPQSPVAQKLQRRLRALRGTPQ